MFATRIIKHGVGRVRASFFERVFLKTGWDRTYPAYIQCHVSERCNYKCKYCNHWNRENYSDEMSLDEWKRSIKSVKQFASPVLLQFSGGEPFVYPHFVDLIEFCHSIGVDWDVITNGSAFASEKLVKRVVAAKPLKVDISVDGTTAEIHDAARGIDGSLARIERGLDLLVAERNKSGQKFPIRIMTTVHRLNAGNLEEIASWAKTHGVTSVTYKPVSAWFGAVDSLLIDDDKTKAVVHEQISKLTHLRSVGGPAIDGLNSFGTHSAGMRSFSVPCRQVIREFTIRPNGDVQLCTCVPYVGNLRKQTAESIWRGDQAANYRRARANCTREYAVSNQFESCNARRSIWIDVQRVFSILRRSQA